MLLNQILLSTLNVIFEKKEIIYFSVNNLSETFKGDA